MYGGLLRPRALRSVDLANRLRAVPSMTCRVTADGKSVLRLEDSDIHRIRAHELDFILRFGLGEVGGPVLESARYGVWSFSHDETLREHGVPAGFWEIYQGETVTDASLMRLKEGDGGIVLRRGSFKTALHSLKRTIDEVFFGSAGWPANVSRDIRAGLADYVNGAASPINSADGRAPTSLQTLRFFARQTRNAIRRADKALRRHEEWSIGVVDQPIAAFLESPERLTVRWLQSPGDGRFVADPFGVDVEGAVHILYEDFDYRTSKGIIATMPIASEKAPSLPRQAIDLPVHASYPYVIEDRGEIYCIPETYEAREVALYRAIEFPARWEKTATLLEGIAALDTTVFRHDGRWWLACTDQEAGKDLRLFLWHAPDLKGPWKPHALNPVKTDVRSSRPAGTPFVHRGGLYRPAQDCSKSYGGGVVVNRVLRLAPAGFQEEFAVRIEPFADSPFPDGVHTLSSVGNVTLVDGKRYRFIPSAIPYVL